MTLRGWCLLLVVALATEPLLHATKAPGDERRRIEAAVRAQQRRGFTGAVAVARGGQMLVDLDVTAPARPRAASGTQYFVASIGKQFTATAVLTCLARRDLSVDVTLERLWPDVPADKRAITVRQILSHTSGLPASDTGELARGADEAAHAILALPLDRQPGTAFEYSNANYQLAAAVVERLCEEPYGRVVHRLFARAGLTDTGHLPDDRPARLAALSHAVPPRLASLRWGGQGYFSTARDLLRWHRALERGQLLSSTARRVLLEPVTPIQEGRAALGWFLGRTGRGTTTVFTRGNEDFGPNGLVYHYPMRDVTIVILTHAGDVGGVSWSRTVLAALEEALAL